jgi:hypothetical protein
MEQLLGQRFSLEDVDYAIVDVRNIQGDTMVYAEPAVAAAGPGRAAFRYADIEAHLRQDQADIA